MDQVIRELQFNNYRAKVVKFFYKKLMKNEITDIMLQQYYNDVNNILALETIDQIYNYKFINKDKIYSNHI